MSTTPIPPVSQSERPAPLTGIRIVDFTTVLAGPYCTYQLALLGAEVIKVERPGSGDFTRNGAALPGMPGLTAGFAAQNASKRSITIDLKSVDGIEIVHRLIEQSDVVVENYSPGVAARLGLGFDAIRKRNSDIVYASLSGYGQDGPYSARPAYDHVIQAISGITMLTGAPETVPNRIGPPLFDYLAGIYAAFAVVSALRERDRTGQAQRVDVAMLDAALVAMASTTSAFLNGGINPTPNGNTASSGSPASGIFPTKDGLIAIAANQEHHVISLCACLGEPSILHDTRFTAPETRKTNAAAFADALSLRLAHRSAADWETLLSARHVPAVRVRTVPQALADEHVISRGVQQKVTDGTTGKTISVPSLGFKWNGQTIGPTSGPSLLGGDTEQILTELGMDAGEIASLRRRGVV